MRPAIALFIVYICLPVVDERCGRATYKRAADERRPAHVALLNRLGSVPGGRSAAREENRIGAVH